MYFIKKNYQRRYKFHVLGRPIKQSDSTNRLSETDIIKIHELLINNIFTMFGGSVLQQTFGISTGTKCGPLLCGLVPLFVLEKFHTEASEEKTKRRC